MDAQKLFRILKDLETDESDLGITTKLDAIRTSVGQNNPDGFAAAQTQLTELLTQLRETSITYGYSHTENLLLKKVGGGAYFGKGLVAQLETMFSGRSFELTTKLDQFKSQRADYIKKAQRLATGFGDMGIEEYRPNAYEVGVVLPEEEADLDKFARRIRDLKLLLSALGEAAGVEEKTIKITRLSNGSLELFSLQPYEIATLLSTLLLNVSMIWDKVAQFRRKMEETDKDPLLSAEAKKEIKATLAKETEKIKKEILEEMPEKFLKEVGKKMEAGRKNEIRNQIRISVRAIFAWFEAGIEVDITPIRVAQDATTTEQQSATIESIEKTNDRLREIYQLPPEIKKLPFQLPDPEEVPEDKEKKDDGGKV